MIRLFAALAAPPEIGRALQARQTGIEGARWRPLEALHVTLRFYGEVRQDIHAVWAGVAESPELRRLADACETAARRAGLKPEKRAYRPHVTLAYLRRPDPDAVAAWIQANNLLKSPEIAIDRFGLYSSHLGRDGSHYRLEAEYRL